MIDKSLLFRLLLGVSLAFNTAIVLEITCREPPTHSPEDMPDETLQRLTKHLSAADSAIVHQAFDAKREDFMKTRAQMHGDLVAVNAAMKADPFDPAALRHAMDDVHRERTSFGSLIEDSIFQSATAVSPEGREKLLPPPREPSKPKP